MRISLKINLIAIAIATTALVVCMARGADGIGEQTATPYMAHLDAKDGHLIDAAPEGPSMTIPLCVGVQTEKNPEPVKHGVATLHVCHVDGSPALTSEGPANEPSRQWKDSTPDTLGGRSSTTI